MENVIEEKHKRFATNPFKDDATIIPKRVKVSGVDPSRVILDKSGEKHEIKFSYNVIKDEEAFVKIYKDNIKKMFDLSTSAYKMFWFIALQLKPSNDAVNINQDEFASLTEYKNRKSFHDGINELLDKGIIAKSDMKGFFFINYSVFFNGDRMRVETVYYKK